jgi:hypothetical protein
MAATGITYGIVLATDKLRQNVEPAEQKYIVLELIFLK